MVETLIYPVGLFWDIKHDIHEWNLKGKTRWRNVRRGFRRSIVNARQRRWRELRSQYNGFLAEHDGCEHNCGRGWTRRAALRDVNRLCELATSDGEADR